MEVSVQDEGPGTRPCDSPANLSPVGLPNPRLLIWASRRFFPRAWATSMVPILDDWARMSEAVSRSLPWASASWNV